MTVRQVVEKPDGARGVSKWDARLERAYHPHWQLRPDARPVFFDPDTIARLHITIDFWDNDAATEFQAKIIAMMPGVEE